MFIYSDDFEVVSADFQGIEVRNLPFFPEIVEFYFLTFYSQGFFIDFQGSRLFRASHISHDDESFIRGWDVP